MEKTEKTIIKHIPDFLNYCAVEKGLSQKTQENYGRYLQRFILWLRESKKDGFKPNELTNQDIWDYRLYLSRCTAGNGKPLKKATQAYYLIALRAILGYFIAKDIVSIPPDKITLPKDAKAEKLVKFLALEQVEKLLDAPKTDQIDNKESPIELRNKTILETLFSTGLRIAELVALNKEQFANIKNKKDLEVGIIGKGGHPRTVYFSERALSWLKTYLETRDDKEKALFVNYRAKKGNVGGRLNRRSIERMVKKYAILAGIPLFTTPHTLRHSMATDLLEKGVDLRTIQEFLGHRSILTTQVYTHVTNKRLRDTHRQFHSLGKDSEKPKEKETKDTKEETEEKE